MDGLPDSLRFLKRVFLNMKDSPQVSLSFRNEMCIDCGQRGDRRLMTNTCHLMKFEPTWLPGKKKSAPNATSVPTGGINQVYGSNVRFFWKFLIGTPKPRKLPIGICFFVAHWHLPVLSFQPYSHCNCNLQDNMRLSEFYACSALCGMGKSRSLRIECCTSWEDEAPAGGYQRVDTVLLELANMALFR